MRLSHSLLLSCLACHHCKKGRARFKHSCYRKVFFKSLSIKDWHHWYQKIPCCDLILLKLSPWRKLLLLQKWSSLYHNDGVWHQVLWQDYGEVWSHVIWTHTFWPICSNCWFWVHLQVKERSSARVSMDAHKGLAQCFTTDSWIYLF